jgi:hypothetical protein
MTTRLGFRSCRIDCLDGVNSTFLEEEMALGMVSMATGVGLGGLLCGAQLLGPNSQAAPTVVPLASPTKNDLPRFLRRRGTFRPALPLPYAT